MATYCYARVSTADQALFGYSLEAQVRAMQEYVQRQGLELGDATNCDMPGFFVDGGQSASKKVLLHRPGGEGLLRNLKEGDTLLATSLHRIFRRLSDTTRYLEQWDRMRIDLRFTDYDLGGGPNGRLMIHILAAVAEWKSQIISARIREANAARRGDAGKPPKSNSPIVVRASKPHKVNQEYLRILQADQLLRAQEKVVRFGGTIRAYVRVSTADQTVEQQVQCIEAAIAQQPDLAGATIQWYVDEGESAYQKRFGKRPSGGRLMADLRPGDMVATWRPDRMFRSLYDMANTTRQIQKAGAFVFLQESRLRSDSPFGGMLLAQLALIAEMESQEISRSTMQGQLISRAGKPPEGVVQAHRAYPGPEALRRSFQWVAYLTPKHKADLFVKISLVTRTQRMKLRGAVRMVCNEWLVRQGFPTLRGDVSDTLQSYLSRLRAMQRAEVSPERARLIDLLEETDADLKQKGVKVPVVKYPLDVHDCADFVRRMHRFERAVKLVRRRTRDPRDAAFVGRCSDPVAAENLLQLLAR